MAHILDTKRPRRSRSIWVASVALFGAALLPFAALRVSARPAATARPTEREISKEPSVSLSSSVNQETDPAATDLPTASEKVASAPASAHDPFSTTSSKSPGQNDRVVLPVDPDSAPPTVPDANVGAPATPTPGSPTERENILDPVVWGTTSDGLQPGILLTPPALTRTWRVPLNSQVHYKLLVRNTTRRERTFVMQCLDTDDWEIPYLIPGNEVVKTLKGPTIPDKFKAKWTNSPLLGLFPAYVVTLLPGETVFVPGLFGLYLGNDNARSFPRVETPMPGTNWLVQPITIDPMTESERKQLTTTVKQPVTLVDRKGQSREATCLVVGAQKKLSIKLLAKMPITIFAPDAPPAGQQKQTSDNGQGKSG